MDLLEEGKYLGAGDGLPSVFLCFSVCSTAVAQSAYEYLNSKWDVRQYKSVTVASRWVIFVFRASFSAFFFSLDVQTPQRLTLFKALFVYNISVTSLTLAILSSCVTTGFYIRVLTSIFFPWRFGPFWGHGLPSVPPANFSITCRLSLSISVSVNKRRCPFIQHTHIYL